MNWKIWRVSIDWKVNSGAKYINYTKEINDNFFYFSEDWIDIYRNWKIKWKIEKWVSIVEVIEDKAILNKDNKIFIVDISKWNKILFEFDESVKKVNVVKKDGFKIEYFITEWGDGKKWMYFRDGKKWIDNIFDDIILDKEKWVFLCWKDWELSYYSYRWLKKETREIFSWSNDIKVRDINVDVPLLNTLDIWNRMLWAERKAKKIIWNETDNYIWETWNIVRALHNSDIKDVMFWLSRKNLKISENFQGIIQKLFLNKWNIDLFKELNLALDNVFGEYLENIYKSRMRKLSSVQLDYLQKTFREKVVKQFIDNINIVKNWKKLQADYSPEMKAYFDTFAKVYNPVIPIEKPKQAPKKLTN